MLLGAARPIPLALQDRPRETLCPMSEFEPRPWVSGGAARALHSACHGHHLALMFFALLGWAAPLSAVLWAHVAFIPTLLAIWRMNGDSCPLNNMESLLTTGRWRNESNTEEGAFVLTIVNNYLGLSPTPAQMNRVIYGVMALVWVLALAHLGLRGSLG